MYSCLTKWLLKHHKVLADGFFFLLRKGEKNTYKVKHLRLATVKTFLVNNY